jgi:hypothetical protein
VLSSGWFLPVLVVFARARRFSSFELPLGSCRPGAVTGPTENPLARRLRGRLGERDVALAVR